MAAAPSPSRAQSKKAVANVKVKFLLNRCARTAGAGARAGLAQRALEAAGIDYHFVVPDSIEQLQREARAAADGQYDALVVGGGDGTIHLAANALLGAANGGPTLPLGILPLGTGNDFSDMAGLPRDLWAAGRVIAAGAVRPVDAGHVRYRLAGDGAGGWQERYFTNNSALAMEPLVTLEVTRITRLSGNIRYIVAVARGLMKLTAWRMRLEWDGGQIEGPTYLLSIANSARTGALFRIAPDARMQDGLLDMVHAPQMSRGRVLLVVPRLLNGSHAGDPRFTFSRVRELTVESDPPTPIHADGELLAEGVTNAHYRVLPGQLSLLAPAIAGEAGSTSPTAPDA
jgi:diacylglycerol kinase (ATP)